MKKRINYIDIARAFAMIFIVMGHTIVHSANCHIIFKFLYSFHVPLFFIISGITFKIKEEESFINFFKNKFIRIMIPYFVWAILFIIPYLMFGNNVGENLGTKGTFELKNILINILYGVGKNSALKQNTSLWFLPALFSMEILYYFIIGYINKHSRQWLIFLIIILSVGIFSNYILRIALPWGINSVLQLGVYFYVGYLLNNKHLLKKENIFDLKKIIPLLIIGLISFYFNYETVSCVDYFYGNIFFAYMSGICLSLFVIYISYIIHENKFLEYIGKNTISILIFHKLIVVIFQSKLGYFSSLLKSSSLYCELLLSIIVSILSIYISLIMGFIVKKLAPQLIGERKY